MIDLVTTISDERLAEMLAEVDIEQENAVADADADQNPMLAVDAVGEFALSEMRSILTELQSLRAQGGVRAPNADGWFALTGDARLGRCATENCGGPSTFRLEVSGVGSNYCFGCADRIKALSSLEASPAPVSEREALIDYLLQDASRNRLMPRVVDIAYTAYTLAKQPNKEDGRPSDWFTDTKPTVDKMIGEVRAALAAKGGH